MRAEILQGDALEQLKSMPAGSVHCTVTSPPYWNLRDYGNDAQIGLEKTPTEYIARLVHVFAEVHRVLRGDGTCWINISDTYANKQRLGIPERLVLALQASGWVWRDEVIWHKVNCMPSSVTDRTTSAHEKVYMLAKSDRYFYDADAIREPLAIATLEDKRLGATGTGRERYSADGKAACPSGFTGANLDGRNKRSVWHCATKSSFDAHFAVFPPDLIKPCILAGCPEGGTVLDCFAGSGTTLWTANGLCRHAIGIELSADYCNLIRKRLAQGFLDWTEEAGA